MTTFNGLAKLLLVVAAFVSLSSIDIFLARAGLFPGASAVGLALCALVLLQRLSRTRRLVFSMRAGVAAQLGAAACAYALFVGWALFGTMYAANPAQGVGAAGRYALYPLSMATLLVVGTDVSMQRALRQGVLIAFALVVASVLIDFIIPRTFSTTLRPSGILGNPNGAAQTICALLLAALLAGVVGRTFWFCVAVAVFAVLATLSRSGILLLMICVGAAIASHSRVDRAGLARIVGIPAALGLGVLLAQMFIGGQGNVTYAGRWEKITSPGGLVDFGDPRVVLLREYLTLWVQRPMLGAGTGASIGADDGVAGAAHNLYVKVLYENGLVGLALLLLSLSALILSSFRKARLNVPTLLACWAFMAAWAVFTNSLLDNRLAYFTAVLITLSSFTLSRGSTRFD